MDLQSRKIARQWFIFGFITAIFVFSLILFIYNYSTSTEVVAQDDGKSAFVVGSMEGVEKVPSQVHQILVKFSSGEVRIDYNAQNEVNWDCDGAGKNAKVEILEDTFSLDLSSAIIDCDISIPPMAFVLEGTHGEVEIRKIQANVDVKLLNGELFLQPIGEKTYSYDLKVDSGTVDETFESSKTGSSIKVKAEMKFGSIEKLD